LFVSESLKGHWLGLGFDARVGMAVVFDRPSPSDRLFKEQPVFWGRALE
jgi:hypothetical protein